MASPGELVLAVSAATGVSLPTVTDLDRQLTKAGLRTKTGRGRSAAHMTPLDAARLMTALLAARQATASVEAVERYQLARLDKNRSSDNVYGDTELAELVALPARHSFVDALAALIASASTGDLRQLIVTAKQSWAPHIEVFAFTRATRGRIRLSGLPNGLTASVEYAPAKAGRNAGPARSGDLEQSRRITGNTIFAIADLLGGAPTDE